MKLKSLLALSLAAVLLGACAKDPEPLEISQVTEVNAIVVAVDSTARILTVRGPRGNEITFGVDQEVRNLGQVEAGDTVTVSYYSGYLVSMAEPGNAGADAEIAAGRTEEGSRPGAMVGSSVRATVEILSVEENGAAVSFRDPNGQILSHQVQREEAQAFARKLSQGDLVDIRYTQAIAVSVSAIDSEPPD